MLFAHNAELTVSYEALMWRVELSGMLCLLLDCFMLIGVKHRT
jgi:hypothetical protein